MKAAVLHTYNTPLEIERPDQVLVRIEGAGVCSTDVHAIEGHLEAAGVVLPQVLGHENAGRVEAVGDIVSTVRPGDPVLLYPPYSCGLCVPCRRGRDMHCRHHEFTGLSLDGGFSEFVRVSERSVVPLPADADPVELAPHADAGITAYHAIKKLQPLLLPDRTVVVIGIGGVGHIGLQLARVLGSSSVVAVDPHPDRRKLAEELGADQALDSAGVVDAVRELTGGDGANVIFDFVGTEGTHADALGMLARDGTYSVIGFGGTVTVPSAALVGQEQAVVANLVGSWTDLWDVLQLQHRGLLELKTERHPFEQINDVLDMLRAGEITGRAVLTPGSNGSA